MSKKLALCIGINDFREYPNINLRGCLNDIKNMRKIMLDYMGFQEENITELINEEATKENIIRSLKSLITKAKDESAEYVFLQISSHGTQTRAVTGEEDMMDEVIVPHDILQREEDWHPEHRITDNEIYDIISKLPQNIIYEAIHDTCHSGSADRGDIENFQLDRRPRLIFPNLNQTGRNLFVNSKIHGSRDVLVSPERRNHILWSGCKDDQTSADANIEGSWNGAFTYHLCDELRKNENKDDRMTLMEKIRNSMKTRFSKQTPQLNIRDDYKRNPFGSHTVANLSTTSPQPTNPTSMSIDVNKMMNSMPILFQALLQTLRQTQIRI